MMESLLDEVLPPIPAEEVRMPPTARVEPTVVLPQQQIVPSAAVLMPSTTKQPAGDLTAVAVESSSATDLQLLSDRFGVTPAEVIAAIFLFSGNYSVVCSYLSGALEGLPEPWTVHDDQILLGGGSDAELHLRFDAARISERRDFLDHMSAFGVPINVFASLNR